MAIATLPEVLSRQILRWTLTEEGLICIWRPKKGPLRTSIIAHSELQRTHPDLTRALIDAQVHQQQINGTSGRSLLAAQVADLCAQRLLTDTRGQQYYVANISGIICHQTSCVKANLSAITYAHGMVITENNETRYFVRKTTTRALTVDAEELERHFPGWRNRYLAGDSLGYVGDQLSHYVLNPQDGPSLTLPAFDATLVLA